MVTLQGSDNEVVTLAASVAVVVTVAEREVWVTIEPVCWTSTRATDPSGSSCQSRYDAPTTSFAGMEAAEASRAD